MVRAVVTLAVVTGQKKNLHNVETWQYLAHVVCSCKRTGKVAGCQLAGVVGLL